VSASEETIIELNKTKILMMVFIALGFVIGGMWIATIDSVEIESYRRFNYPWLIHGIGLSIIIFFGYVCALLIKKLFDTKPGLVFNNIGIVDNTSVALVGIIPWADISGAAPLEFNKQKMLVVRVKNPEKYVAQGNIVQRLIVKANHKFYGSPIIFTSTILNVDASELAEIFNQYFAKLGCETR